MIYNMRCILNISYHIKYFLPGVLIRPYIYIYIYIYLTYSIYTSCNIYMYNIACIHKSPKTAAENHVAESNPIAMDPRPRVFHFRGVKNSFNLRKGASNLGEAHHEPTTMSERFKLVQTQNTVLNPQATQKL